MLKFYLFENLVQMLLAMPNPFLKTFKRNTQFNKKDSQIPK